MVPDGKSSASARDSRRRFLKALSVSTIIGVTGCTGNQQNSTNNSGGSGSGNDINTGADTGSGSTSNTQFVNAKTQPLAHLDPHAINDGTMVQLGLVYDTLFDYEQGDPTTVNPMLATNIESKNSAQQWVITLREGVKFDDGTKFNSYAAKRSLMRTKKLSAGQSKPYDWFESVDESGSHEITINCGEAFGPAPAALTFITTSMMNPTILDEHWEEKNFGHEYFQTHVHGTGAFQLQNWDKGNTFEATLKQENNWRQNASSDLPANLAIPERANVTDYRNTIIREQLTQKQKLARGDIDLAEDLTWTNINRVIKNDNVSLYDGEPDFYNKYVFMDCQREPMSNVKFRKALAYAADYKGIAEGLVKTGVPWGTPWAEGIWPRVTEGRYRQNLEKARQMLKETNYDGRELTFRSIKNPENDKVGQALVANFNEIGINVDHNDIPWSNLYEQLTSQETMPDLLMYNGWPDYADPNGPAIRYWGEYWPPAGWNTAYYKNEKYDEMFVKARSSGDKEKRVDLYKKMQQILLDEVPIIWLFQNKYVRAYNNAITNLHYTPGEFNYLAAHQFAKQTSD